MATVLVAGLSPSLERQIAEWPEYAVAQCRGERSEIISCCRRLQPAVLLVAEQFISAVPELISELSAGVVQTHVVGVCNGDAETIAQLLNIGCSGFLREDTPAADLRRAILGIATGELWFPRKILSHAVRTILPAVSSNGLTQREKQILQLIEQGFNNREIAQKLFITRETVRWHVRSLNAKIGSRDRKRITTVPDGEPRTWDRMTALG